VRKRTGDAYGARVGLRAVADALASYGMASADQLAAELGVSSRDRPALAAALDYWIDRGAVRVEMLPSCVSGGCDGACAACVRRQAPLSAARVKAYRWVVREVYPSRGACHRSG